MKTTVKMLISVILLSLLLFAGCYSNETPQVVYSIGKEYVFDTIKVIVEHDETQEMFVLYYDVLEQEVGTHYFSFSFHYDTETLRNSDQFEYYDDFDSTVEFDENGYYVFDTSKTFYISYQNATSDVKSIINSKNCTLEFPIGTFAFNTIDNDLDD